MTKKRFKFGLAVLGVLGIFFMALLALVFAPNLASADKSTGLGHHQDGDSPSGHHNPAFYALYDGPQTGPGPHGGNDSGNRNGDYCALNHCEADASPDDGSNHEGYQSGQGGQNGGNGQSGGNGQGGSGNGQGNGQGNDPGNGQGPYAGGGFGGPSGNFAPGAPGGDPNGCPDSKKTCDKDTGDQGSGNQGSGNQGSNGDGSHNNDGGDNHQDGSPHGQSDDPNGPSSNGNDPQPGPTDLAITNTTDGDPTGDNPPGTVLTDAPVQVPEPFTLSLFTVGLGGAVVLRRRSKASRKAA